MSSFFPFHTFFRSLTHNGLSSKFKKLLTPGKISQTLCLGNLTDRTTYEYLRRVSPDLKLVRGRCDVEASSLPLTQVVVHGSLRIGFLEGFTLVSGEPDLLLAEANRLDVDVLCWGGGTHRFDAFEYMDKFFVNPGSATGAFTVGWSGDMAEKKSSKDGRNATADEEGNEIIPSFCLMDVWKPLQNTSLYNHFLRHGDVVHLLTREFYTSSQQNTGPRNFSYSLCISVKKRCEWG